MLDSNKKNELINNLIKELNIKSTQTFRTHTISPARTMSEEEVNGYIHTNMDIEFDGQEIVGARINSEKNSIVAENCKFTDIQFRGLICPKIIFINCDFEDFDIIGGNLENITFIACNFLRFRVKNGSVTEKVNLKGMKLVRCNFEAACDIKGAILDNSQWLDTDINNIGIVTDRKDKDYCLINNIVSDDIRDKSEIKKDINNDIKNIDINTLEKTVIADKDYSGETIDISLFVNTDFFNCKFTGCVFESKVFDDNGLLSYEMRTAFTNCYFEKSTFICTLKSIRFDNCNFIKSKLLGMFLSCQFLAVKFQCCDLSPETVMNYSFFINCDFEDTDMDLLKKNEFRSTNGDVGVVYCERVDKLKNIHDLECQIDDLKKEKEDAITESNSRIELTEQLEKQLEEKESKLADVEKKIKSNEEQVEDYKLQLDKTESEVKEMNKEMEMKLEEIKELQEKLANIEKERDQYEEKIDELQNLVDILEQKENTGNADELLLDIIKLIKDKTGITLAEEKKLDDESVTDYLANLSEDERMNLFSKATMFRMQKMMNGVK